MTKLQVDIPLATTTTDGLLLAKDKALINSISGRKTMTGGGTAADIDVIIMLNTTAVTINPTLNQAIPIQTFMLRGSAPVTIQGGTGQSIDGGMFTKVSGTPTAPVAVTLVRNPDQPTQFLRLNT